MKCLDKKGKMSLMITILLAGSLSIGGTIIKDNSAEDEKNINNSHIIEADSIGAGDEIIYTSTLPNEVTKDIQARKEKEKIIEQMKAIQKERNKNEVNVRIQSLEDSQTESIKEEVIKTEDSTQNNIDTEKETQKVNVDKGFERYALYDIKMPIEHQKYLYKLCKEKNLDYIKTLAILKHESQFDVNLVHSNKNGTKDYGYMQVNSCNHENFAKELGTPIDPLDPYINLQWGTHELKKLKDLYSGQGLTGRELFESIQSGYNKGVYGFKKYGKAERYIKRTDRELKWLQEKLNL